MTMWIMLNNRPLDISKIKEISEVKTLDSKYFLEQWDNKYYNLRIPEINIDKLKVPDELRNTKYGDLQKDAKGGNKVWGYFFYIRELTQVQSYLNGVANGVDRAIEKRYSKVYSTKKAAQTALEHLLSEINEVYNKLVKVEI